MKGNEPYNRPIMEYLNLTNASDALADFDGDGLTNLEEYHRDPSGDFDHDGIPDIYDSDDDNDGIPTSVELQDHLDPFYEGDAEADLDNDGLSNIFEYRHGLDIQSNDTDHDGINDGEEYHYWQEKLKKVHPDWDDDRINSTAISYCRIPDVDGDGIPDGKEIKGYEVKIIVGWKSDGTPISRMRFISPSELNPLTPYKNKTGVWTDTDQDGIPDIVESMLSNRSRWSYFS